MISFWIRRMKPLWVECLKFKEKLKSKHGEKRSAKWTQYTYPLSIPTSRIYALIFPTKHKKSCFHGIGPLCRVYNYNSFPSDHTPEAPIKALSTLEMLPPTPNEIQSGFFSIFHHKHVGKLREYWLVWSHSNHPPPTSKAKQSHVSRSQEQGRMC